MTHFWTHRMMLSTDFKIIFFIFSFFSKYTPFGPTVNTDGWKGVLEPFCSEKKSILAPLLWHWAMILRSTVWLLDFISKTKQFRAMVTIDDQSEVLHGLFHRTHFWTLQTTLSSELKVTFVIFFSFFSKITLFRATPLRRVPCYAISLLMAAGNYRVDS